MSKPVALVLGSTGTIGLATVKHLASTSGANMDIRAGTRNPANAPDSIKLPGVKIVKAAFGDDKQHLKDVFKEVDRLFIIPPGLESFGDMVNDVVEIAKEANIKHVLLLTAPSAHVPPDHKYRCANGSFYFIEKKFLELFPDGTAVSHPYFMENIFGIASSIKAEKKFSSPLDPNIKLPWMASDDAGKFNAAILSDPTKHQGKYYNLNNDLRSYSELATFLSEATENKVEYVHQTYEQFASDMKRNGVKDFVEGHESITVPATKDHFEVTGEKPLTLQQWCHQNAKQFQ